MERQENRTGFESRSRLLAKLVRGLLARETFESLSDLTEALKVRCARLRIAWTHDDISQAYRLIESNRPLVTSPVTPPRRPIEPVDDGRFLSRAEAKALYDRLFADECERRRA